MMKIFRPFVPWAIGALIICFPSLYSPLVQAQSDSQCGYRDDGSRTLTFTDDTCWYQVLDVSNGNSVEVCKAWSLALCDIKSNTPYKIIRKTSTWGYVPDVNIASISRSGSDPEPINNGQCGYIDDGSTTLNLTDDTCWYQVSDVSNGNSVEVCKAWSLPSCDIKSNTPYKIVRKTNTWGYVPDANIAAISRSGSESVVTGLCEGYRINDKQNRPMRFQAKPNPGGSYFDKAFGSKITRISNSSAVSSGIVKTMYNTIQAWNSDESLMILYHGSNGHYLYNGQPPYEQRQKLNIVPKDIEQVFWHSNDADKIIYPDQNNNLMEYRVSTQRSTTLHNFDNISECRASGINAGSDVQMLPNGSTDIGLRCGTNLGFRFDIINKQITRMSTRPGSYAPQIFPSGRFSFHEGSILESDMQVFRALDLNDDVEHSHLGQLHDGTDAYFSVAFGAGNCASDGSLVVHSPESGACRVLVGGANGYPYALSGTHMNAGSYKNPGWVVVSSVGYGAEGDSLLEQEVYISNTDPNDSQVCRIAHHRSNGKLSGSILREPYLSEPHPVLSPSGTRVLFSSDWNNSGAVDVYVIELPAHSSQ